MWKSISIFLLGVLSALAVFLKFKQPNVINVAGDNVESQKVKDNSKHKLSRIDKRIRRKENRILKRKLKGLS